MKVTLNASTGAKILVWREEEIFHARREGTAELDAQACLAVDLFEVVAELAGLSLDDGAQAAEAMNLAELAQRRLALVKPESAVDGEPEENGPSAQVSG
jgi:hypothetical protein